MGQRGADVKVTYPGYAAEINAPGHDHVVEEAAHELLCLFNTRAT